MDMNNLRKDDARTWRLAQAAELLHCHQTGEPMKYDVDGECIPRVTLEHVAANGLPI